MNSSLRVLCCLALLGLSGCITQQKIPIDNEALKQCKMVCTQHLDSCKQNCNNNCPMCSSYSNFTSAANYFKYVHEKHVEGGFIDRGLNSYRDPLQCRKVTCNCTSDFNTCIQGCTGVVQKQLRSVPYCT